MDVPRTVHVDSLESYDDFIIVGETKTVASGLIKSPVNVEMSDTIPLVEGNTITHKNIAVSEHHGNGVESGFTLPLTEKHTLTETGNYVQLTGVQIDESLLHQYSSVANIPLPPEIGVVSSECIIGNDTNVVISEESVSSNEPHIFADPSMTLAQEHFTEMDKIVSSDHELAQNPAFISNNDIPQLETVYIMNAEEPALETIVQYHESATSVLEDLSGIQATESSELPVSEITNSCNPKVVFQENVISDSSVNVPNEDSTPHYLNLESCASSTIYQTDNVSVPVPVTNDNASNTVIDLVLPVVDIASVTLTDPVPQRPKKLTSRCVENVDKVSPSISLKDESKEGIVKKVSMACVIPRHLMGRTVEDSSIDVGPNIQRPRLGVKVPCRNLTSQIISKEELAQELQERSKRNFPNIETPGGDIIFSKNMTKRLAGNLNVGASKVKNESKNPLVMMKKLPVERPVAVKKPTIRNSDDEDLLAILEGDVDDWSIDRPPPQLIEAARSPPTHPVRNDPPKLDPAVEREMALKQLNDMPVRKTKKYPTTFKTQTPRKNRFLVKKPLGTDSSTKTVGYSKALDAQKYARKRKVLDNAEDSSKISHLTTEALESNGDDIMSEEGGGKKTEIIKAPRIFKTKKSLKLTNGTLGTVKKTGAAGISTSYSLSVDQKTVKVETVIDSNSVPNKSYEKTAKSVKKLKRPAEETEPVSGDEPAEATARNLVSPPRTYSSRIKKSTYSDDFVFPSTSKSRVVPIVGNSNSNKESKSVKAIKATPAKVIPAIKEEIPENNDSNETPPVKRGRGRPKGAKLKVQVRMQSSEKLKSPAVTKVKVVKVSKLPKKTPPKKNELDRLLQDEGAINMLYSVERDEEKRRTGSPVDFSPPKRALKSTRRSHKDLLMKTRLVQSAVQRLKNSADDDTPTVSLRTKRTTLGTPNLKNESNATPQRKTSFDSNMSMQSPPSLTPIEPSSPTQIFTYPPRLRPPAEASRIIRRHSSSSNFSSRSTSPNPSRRLSMDAMSPQSNNVDLDEPSTSGAKESRKRGNSIYITKSEVQNKYKKKKRNPDGTINTSVEDSFFQPREVATEELLPASKAKLKDEKVKNLQKTALKKGGAAFKVKKSPSTDSGRSVGRPRKVVVEVGKAPDLTKCLAEAVTAFIAEDGNLDSSSLPPELPKESCTTSPTTPFASISYTSLIRTLELDCQRRTDDSAKERSSPRQSVGFSNYKELSVRRHENMVQVMISPVSTKLMNSLNPQVLRELRDVLNLLRKDDTCRAVLVTSTGSSFCLGVDFHSLIIDKADKRKVAAQEFALALKQFMTSLSQFTKPIIAGVHGAAIGLGVTMLPFFDMVFASDKATFYTPYAKLGQVPEGAAVVTMPQLLGNAVTSELLYACRKLTATEALHYGLVTRILWPDKFQEELLPLIRTLANQSAQSMEATKALLRFNLRARVDAALESESLLLVQHWTSTECQTNFKRFLDDEDIGLQRQRVDA